VIEEIDEMGKFTLLLAMSCAVVTAPAVAKVNYRVIDLGVLGTAESSYATAINSRGEIVGDSSDGSTFIYDPLNGMRYLDCTPNKISQTRSINDSGQVVGDKVYDDGRYRATLWKNGASYDLGAISSTNHSAACGINNAGQVVGWSWTSEFRSHAFIWNSVDGMQDMGTLAVPVSVMAESTALDINDVGQVVGRADEYYSKDQTFVWSKSNGMQKVSALSWPNSINNQGVIAGVSSSTNQAAIWSETDGLRELDILPDWLYSQAWYINDIGQVVGRATCSDWRTRWFIWDSVNGTQILGTDDWLNISGINSNGQLIGYRYYGTFSDPNTHTQRTIYHAALWQPVPEPSSFLAVLCGIGGMGTVVWRRKSA
jgi:probable HAF family extracellular repeat protein